MTTFDKEALSWIIRHGRFHLLKEAQVFPDWRLRTVHKVNILQLAIEEIHIPSVDFQPVTKHACCCLTRSQNVA